jgi:ubiquinol-cytochrome c reductase cytochrome c1 subunit
MIKKTILSSLAAGVVLSLSLSIPANIVFASAEHVTPPSQKWSTDGAFGKFDRKQLKRGLQVYMENCASCHSLRLIYYRNLTEIGYSENQVKKLIEEAEVPAGPNAEGETHADGEPIMRKAKLFDRFIKPFPNDIAARVANNGALPPDLSLMTKARPGGADYLYALLAEGFKEAPKGVKVQEGMNYNEYFSGQQIAMAAPLSDDGVEYTDGTKATIAQQARDITAFLIWTAEPELQERKNLGLKVMIFLIVFTAMLYAVKRNVWAKLH